MNFIYFSGKIVNPQYILYIEDGIQTLMKETKQ